MSSSPKTAVDEAVQPPGDPSNRTSTIFKQRISRNFPRSRNGCLTCRSRRKKCDENRPICTGCVKNKLQCVFTQPCTQEKGNIITSQKLQTVEVSQFSNSFPFVFTDTLFRLNDSSPSLPKKPNVAPFLKSSSPFFLISAKPCFQEKSFPKPRSSLFNSTSNLLYNFFVSETAHQIVPAAGVKNPFLNIVLPIAFSDQLVMNGVLSLAGAHLRFDDSLSAETVAATWSHHSLVLRDLQVALSRSPHHQESETLRMLLTILLLCLVESISGNSQDTFLHHLHASRELVFSIMSKPKGIENPANHDLWAFLLEMYSYMVLVATITPLGTENTQILTLDSFLCSSKGMSQHGIWGNFFSGQESIFEFIPEVSLLTSQRRAEEEKGVCSTKTYAQYKDLESRIRAWSMMKPTGADSELAMQQTAASIIWQAALVIYLQSSFFESLHNDSLLVSEIDTRVEVTMPLLKSLSLTPHGAILMWPAMIIGSCARQERQWEVFRVIGMGYKMDAVKKAVGLLSSLWYDPDPRAYGPRGLDFVMRKRGSNICMF